MSERRRRIVRQRWLILVRARQKRQHLLELAEIVTLDGRRDQLKVAAHPISIDDLAEQDGAAIPELRYEVIELVPRIGQCDWLRTLEDLLAREEGYAFGALQPRPIEPKRGLPMRATWYGRHRGRRLPRTSLPVAKAGRRQQLPRWFAFREIRAENSCERGSAPLLNGARPIVATTRLLSPGPRISQGIKYVILATPSNSAVLSMVCTMIGDREVILRGQAVEGYDAIPSLDTHGDMIRQILVEVSLLTERYRYVSRHDIPYVRELAGLLDVLWQEVEMEQARPKHKLA